MFGIINMYTDEIKQIGELTSQNKKNYANKHGYKYFEINNKNQLDLTKTLYDSKFMEPFGLAIGWSKIKLIKDILINNPDIDWLFWIDADAIFMNFDIRLESLISNKAFFIVGRDCNGINVGTFFIKNCERSIKFLQNIWDYGPQKGSWWTETEQGQLDLFGQKEEYFDGFWIVPNNKFNSYIHDCSSGPLPCYKYQPKDFVIHVPGQSNYDKYNILKFYLEQIEKK